MEWAQQLAQYPGGGSGWLMSSP
uniref:Uncharacterized protein n=1 Tax=Plectus sambesii TaxID=2011161 RepID=A0A914V676_9BILA